MSETPPREKEKNRRPLLEPPDLKPEERLRIGRAVVSLLGWGLVASAVLGLLGLWHLIRRGRVLRANLNPPKVVSLSESEKTTQTRHPPV